MFGFGFPELCIILTIIVPSIFWIIALVDILKNEFTANNKVIWLLVVILIPIAGFILYFTIGRKQKIRTV